MPREPVIIRFRTGNRVLRLFLRHTHHSKTFWPPTTRRHRELGDLRDTAAFAINHQGGEIFCGEYRHGHAANRTPSLYRDPDRNPEYALHGGHSDDEFPLHRRTPGSDPVVFLNERLVTVVAIGIIACVLPIEELKDVVL